MATPHLKNAVTLYAKFGHGGHLKIEELRAELARRADPAEAPPYPAEERESE
jgi:hypothetical protein